MMGLGTQEIVFIAAAVLLLFGGKKIPELMRGLGQGVREFKDAQEGITKEVKRTIESRQQKEEKEQKEADS